MGDPKICSIPCANGVVFGEDCGWELPSLSELRNDDSWSRAEMAAQEIFSMIQPTLVADQKRKNVVEHVQRLIRYFTGCEVFPYGSVPLKTYLPNGDVDLTAFCCLDSEDFLVSEVYSILRGEEHNNTAQYKVKDVHCIDAEVKLVKCIVQDVVVDISFNQLGGLSTLCFLEQVDRFIGKDHLFKRSIILVKAWCYYESRILGAHHGLISTYALETLVLYILHKFHSSLMGPLAVLYKFLDYFSTFDWENYCVSLKGPVCMSSLPNIVAELSEDGKDDVLLSEDFLQNCLNIFSISSTETNLRPFSLKYLNIIDPLKEANNLGRSVGRGNFYRIRSAFKYGAEQLGRIILLPRERISDELRKFFANCLDRPGSNCWTDMQDTALASGVIASEQCSHSTCSETFYEQKYFVESTAGLKIPAANLASAPVHEPKRRLLKMVSSKVAPELVQGLDGHVKDGCSGMKSGFSGCFPVCNHSTASFLPSSHMAQKCKDNGKTAEWKSIEEHDANSDASLSEFLLDDRKKHLVVSNLAGSCNGYDNISQIDSYVLNDVTNVSENMKEEIHSISSSSGASNLLLELTGDYDIHYKNLQYGQLSQGYAMSLPPILPLSPQLPCKNPLRAFYRTKTFPHNNSSQSDINDIALGPRIYPANRLSLPLQTAFEEENKKPRGTGTFFLSPSCNLYNKRPYHGRGRNHAAENHRPFWRHIRRYDVTRREFSSSAECGHEFLQAECLSPSSVDSGSSESHHSNSATTQQGLNSIAKCAHEHRPVEHPVLGHRSSRSSDYFHPSFTVWGSFEANAFMHSFENLELESSCHKSANLPVEVNQLETGTSYRLGSPSSPGVGSTNQFSSDQGRGVIQKQSYHLKNEDDFPPLSM